ncbi:MAG: hypothetical protein WBP22_00325 [Candidatus Saccharimonas sp.]
MIIFYIIQGILHAFISSKTAFGKALDIAVLIVSLLVTLTVSGWNMLWLPFVVLIIGGGVLGAFVDAARVKGGRQ